MRYPYAAVGLSGMYSTKTLSRLCNGDVIWVVEGPTKFALVDCFQYSDTEYPPFASDYSKFEIRVLGNHSLLGGSSYPLNVADKWFAELHSRFITKQKFFNLLTTELEIIEGLRLLSGIKL